jgi:hypothetical protein
MKRKSTILILIVILSACKAKIPVNNSNSALKLPNTEDVIILRADFSDKTKWKNVCKLISESGKKLGFKPYVEYLSEKKYDGLEKYKLLNRNDSYKHLFIFIVDSISINHKENPILCINLYDNSGESFRLIPFKIWEIENNLSISNVDFEELLESIDGDGIYRGTK